MTTEIKKTALVSAVRMEEKPPGEGVPAGWLPEILYRLLAEDVPDKPEGHTIQVRFKEDLLIRKLEVTRGGESWDLMIRIGNATRLLRTPGLSFSSLSIQRWPHHDKPERVKKGQEFLLTLYRRSKDSGSKVEEFPPFECLIRGAETRS